MRIEINEAFAVVDMADDDLKNGFQLISHIQSFYCYTETPEQKLKWLTVFQECQDSLDIQLIRRRSGGDKYHRKIAHILDRRPIYNERVIFNEITDVRLIFFRRLF